MKTKLFFLTALITVLLASCVSTTYYQVYKATPTGKTTLKEDLLIFEDQNCVVSYNLWDEGGNVGFKFYNKTSQNIYLHLEDSFFILNGISYNYYKNRVYTTSNNTRLATSHNASVTKSISGLNISNLIQSAGVSATNSVGVVSSSGSSVAYNEEQIVCIPGMTAKIITEYSINSSLIRDCDLLRYPTEKQIKPRTYTKSNSPLVFSNRMTYIPANSMIPEKIENEFYVSEITNLPEKQVIGTRKEVFCGEESSEEVSYFKNATPDQFYIKYIKEKTTDDKAKH
jgi:hypothetical protein